MTTMREEWSSEDDESGRRHGFDAPERHPLLRARHGPLDAAARIVPERAGVAQQHRHVDAGGVEISGGLAQALCFDDDDEFAARTCGRATQAVAARGRVCARRPCFRSGPTA